MAPSRYYSSVARRTTLTGDINSTATTMTVAAATGYPSTTPYTLIIDQDTVNEEIVEVTARSGTSLTITRGVDGTTGIAHTAGAAIEHGVSARDFGDSRSHEDASENVHGTGAGSAVVGTTDTQTLTNKTLTSPTINGATVSGTISGAATLSGQTITSATLGGDLAAGSNKITGLSDPASAQDASTKAYVDSVIATGAANAAAAAASATAAATSATNAGTSETNASTSATAAATSATNAEASFDSFDDRYLGAKSSDPSGVDNDGDALVTGALVFNSTSNEMKVWNGSAWQLVDSSSGIAETLIDAKGDLIVGSADNTAARLAVGADTFVLTADSAEATGVKWAASTGGGAGLQDIFFLMGA